MDSLALSSILLACGIALMGGYIVWGCIDMIHLYDGEPWNFERAGLLATDLVLLLVGGLIIAFASYGILGIFLPYNQWGSLESYPRWATEATVLVIAVIYRFRSSLKSAAY